MIISVREDEDSVNVYFIQEKGDKLRVFKEDNPLIIRWQRFVTYFYRKRADNQNKIRSVYIKYEPRYKA